MQRKAPVYIPKVNTKLANCNLNFYAFNAVFRVVVKPFLKLTGRSSADYFHDPQSMPRILKKKKRLSIPILLFDHVSTVYYGC